MQTTFPAGEPKCSMCMNLNKDPVDPVDCGHYFCKSCTRRFIEKTTICPVCKKENLFRGNQPVGHMTWRSESYSSLPGYEKFGTILLTFNFDSGIQGIIKLQFCWRSRLHVFLSRRNAQNYRPKRGHGQNLTYNLISSLQKGFISFQKF